MGLVDGGSIVLVLTLARLEHNSGHAGAVELVDGDGQDGCSGDGLVLVSGSQHDGAQVESGDLGEEVSAPGVALGGEVQSSLALGAELAERPAGVAQVSLADGGGTDEVVPVTG